MWVSIPWAGGAHTNKTAHLGPGSTCPDAAAGSGGGGELVAESWHDLRLREKEIGSQGRGLVGPSI